LAATNRLSFEDELSLLEMETERKTGRCIRIFDDTEKENLDTIKKEDYTRRVNPYGKLPSYETGEIIRTNSKQHCPGRFPIVITLKLV